MMIRLREVRERLFVTQAELSERSGITEASISRIETGQRTPRLSTIRRLADALGVPPGDLVTWGSSEERATAQGKDEGTR